MEASRSPEDEGTAPSSELEDMHDERAYVAPLGGLVLRHCDVLVNLQGQRRWRGSSDVIELGLDGLG